MRLELLTPNDLHWTLVTLVSSGVMLPQLVSLEGFSANFFTTILTNLGITLHDDVDKYLIVNIFFVVKKINFTCG